MEQARALREHRAAELDWWNLAEEVEDLGRSERRELQNRLEVLLARLLKWRFQRKRRSRSWNATIAVQHVKIRQHLAQNPGLKPSIPTLLAQAYEPARIEVASRLPATASSATTQILPLKFRAGDERPGRVGDLSKVPQNHGPSYMQGCLTSHKKHYVNFNLEVMSP